MNFRKLLVTGLIVCLASMMMFTGCTPSEETPSDVSTPAEDDVMKAALLTSGPINDGGWNTIAYNGLLLIEEKYGFEISNSENVKQDDQVTILRELLVMDMSMVTRCKQWRLSSPMYTLHKSVEVLVDLPPI
jgi:basic membrane protein A